MSIAETEPSAASLEQSELPRQPHFNAAEIGALAHLYRGEVYRSTVWRTRARQHHHWAVVTTGIALSATYASVNASPLPLVLVGLLVVVFLPWAELIEHPRMRGLLTNRVPAVRNKGCIASARRWDRGSLKMRSTANQPTPTCWPAQGAGTDRKCGSRGDCRGRCQAENQKEGHPQSTSRRRR